MLVLVLQKGIGQFPYHKSFDEKLSVVAKNTEQREYLVPGTAYVGLRFMLALQSTLRTGPTADSSSCQP